MWSMLERDRSDGQWNLKPVRGSEMMGQGTVRRLEGHGFVGPHSQGLAGIEVLEEVR